jgi:hypothetical protein
LSSFFTYIYRYVGFGICARLQDEQYTIASPNYACPWVWHTQQGNFKKGDQVGLVGCVKDGYYLCNFFLNDTFIPWYNFKYNFQSTEKEIFLHFAIVTGEKFTLARPKLGNYYYYNKFKNSPAYEKGRLYRGDDLSKFL